MNHIFVLISGDHDVKDLDFSGAYFDAYDLTEVADEIELMRGDSLTLYLSDGVKKHHYDKDYMTFSEAKWSTVKHAETNNVNLKVIEVLK